MDSWADMFVGFFLGSATTGAVIGLWGPITRLFERLRPIVKNYRHACTDCTMAPERRDVPDRVRLPRARRAERKAIA